HGHLGLPMVSRRGLGRLPYPKALDVLRSAGHSAIGGGCRVRAPRGRVSSRARPLGVDDAQSVVDSEQLARRSGQRDVFAFGRFQRRTEGLRVLVGLLCHRRAPPPPLRTYVEHDGDLPEGHRLSSVGATCDICGPDTSATTVFSGRDYEYGVSGEWRVVRCDRCGFHFQWPKPDPAEIPTFYPPTYSAFSDDPAIGWMFRA